MRVFKLTVCLIVSCISLGIAQENIDSLEQQKNDISWMSSAGSSFFGFGIGLPYGGIGFNLSHNVANRLNLFAGLGYNFNNIGFNAGISADYFSKDEITLYVTGMGGYNSVTVVSGLEEEYNKTFYGISFGTGIKIALKDNQLINAGLILPIRNSEYNDTVDAIENDPRIETFNKPLPILFTIGYQVAF